MWEDHLAENLQQALKEGNPWALAAGALSCLLLAGMLAALFVNLKKNGLRNLLSDERKGSIPVAWNINLIPLAFLWGMVVLAIVGMAFRAVFPPPAFLYPDPVNYRAGRLLAGNILLQGSFVLALCLLLKTRCLGIWQLGLGRWKRAYLKTGLGAYLSIMPVMIIAVMLSGLFRDTAVPDQEIFHLLFTITSLPLSLFALLVVGLVGPFLEEVLFRGFLFPTLRAYFGFKRSLIYSSVLFAGLHQSVTAFLPILVLALLLGYLYDKTGSLWPAITLHAANNSVATLMVFFISRAV